MLIAITSDLHHGHSKNTSTILDRFWMDIKNLNPELLIIAGDMISTKQRSLVKMFKQLRRYLDCDVVVVFGNHDYWDGRGGLTHIKQLFPYHAKICNDFNITDLNITSYGNGRIWVTGFDGWYASSRPPSNDLNWMPHYIEGVPTHVWMGNRAGKSLDRLLQIQLEVQDPIKLCVTHFPPFSANKFDKNSRHVSHDYTGDEFNANPRYLDFIADRFQYLICGHSHQKAEEKYKDLLILNSGSDYDKPKFLTLNI